MKAPRPTTLQRLGEVEIAVALRMKHAERRLDGFGERLEALEVLLRQLEDRCLTALDGIVRDLQQMHTVQDELRQGAAELTEFLEHTPTTRKDN